jgi:hypothetical protein
VSNSIATGTNGETAEYVFVTPEMAVSWLAKNIDRNRNVKKSRINGHAHDIQNESSTSTDSRSTDRTVATWVWASAVQELRATDAG